MRMYVGILSSSLTRNPVKAPSIRAMTGIAYFSIIILLIIAVKMLRKPCRHFAINSSILQGAKEMRLGADSEFKIKPEYLPRQFADVVL